MSAKQTDKPRRSRATHAIRVRRTEEALRIILDGAQWFDVVEFVREAEVKPGSAWFVEDGRKPLSCGAIRKYIGWANALIDQSHENSRRRLLRLHVAKRNNLYAKAVNSGDLRTALAVLDSLDKLQGLFPDKDAELLAELKRMQDELDAIKASRETENRP